MQAIPISQVKKFPIDTTISTGFSEVMKYVASFDHYSKGGVWLHCTNWSSHITYNACLLQDLCALSYFYHLWINYFCLYSSEFQSSTCKLEIPLQIPNLLCIFTSFPARKSLVLLTNTAASCTMCSQQLIQFTHAFFIPHSKVTWVVYHIMLRASRNANQLSHCLQNLKPNTSPV